MIEPICLILYVDGFVIIVDDEILSKQFFEQVKQFMSKCGPHLLLFQTCIFPQRGNLFYRFHIPQDW